MMDINSKVLAVLQSSTCFAIAYDETAPECKKCDVSAQCKVKSSGFPLDNATTRMMDKALEPVQKESKNKTKTKSTSTKSTKSKTTTKKNNSTKKTTKKAQTPKKETPQIKISGEMPEFKAMSLDELKELAGKYSVEWKDYGNDNITRMRLIMQLKKCYQ